MVISDSVRPAFGWRVLRTATVAAPFGTVATLEVALH